MKTKSILLFYLLFPILAPAQTVDFERDSLLVGLPYANVLQVLASQVPGFYISSVDNAEGDMSATMMLRGMNVVPESKSTRNMSVNAPAIIVDGLLFTGSISEISTADIEKVEVVKGASAAVLYGTRAGNGAIVITTRRGRTGMPRVRFNAGCSSSDWSHRPEGVNDEWTGYISRKGIGQQYDLSISGADEAMDYYVSGNYIRQQGILLGDDLRRANVLAKLECRPADWILVGVKGAYTGTLSWGATPRLQSAFWMNNPAERYSTVPGYEHWHSSMPDGVTRNPLLGRGNDESYLYTDKETTDSRLDGTAWLNVEIPFLKGLNIHSIFHARREALATDSFTKPENFVNTAVLDEMAKPHLFNFMANGYSLDQIVESWQLKNTVSYERVFSKHKIGFFAGIENECYNSSLLKATFSGFDTPTNLGVYTMDMAQNCFWERSASFYNYDSYSAGFDYSFADRIHVSAGWRRDTLIFNNKMLSTKTMFKNNYYNVSLDVDAIADKLSIRASYGGYTGADKFSIIQGMTAINKFSVGAELRNRDGRFWSVIDLYRDYSKGFHRNIVPAGSTSDMAISNTGVELSLRNINFNGDGVARFRWESSLIMAFNLNRIEMLYGKKDYNIAIANAQLYGYDIYYALATGKPASAVFALEYSDNPAYIGDQDPQLVVNLGNTLAWKKASLWFNFRCAYGSKGHFLGYDTVNKEWVSRNYLKLSDLALSYNVCKGINIYLSGVNLLTFTKWPALDPENGGTIAATSVSDSFQSLPTFRTLRLGITSSF